MSDSKIAKVFKCKHCGGEWVEKKNGPHWSSSGFTTSNPKCPSTSNGQHDYQFKCYLEA